MAEFTAPVPRVCRFFIRSRKVGRARPAWRLLPDAQSRRPSATHEARLAAHHMRSIAATCVLWRACTRPPARASRSRRGGRKTARQRAELAFRRESSAERGAPSASPSGWRAVRSAAGGGATRGRWRSNNFVRSVGDEGLHDDGVQTAADPPERPEREVRERDVVVKRPHHLMAAQVLHEPHEQKAIWHIRCPLRRTRGRRSRRPRQRVC